MLDTAEPLARTQDGSLARLLAVCTVLVVCVAFLPPIPSVTVALGRARSRLLHAQGDPRGTGLTPSTLPRTIGETLAAVIGWALVTLVAASGKLPVDVITPLLALTAMIVAAEFVSDSGRMTRPLKAAITRLTAAVVTGCTIGVACVLAGTRSWTALVDTQGAWPWQWALFTQPALVPAFVVYLAYSGRLLAVRADADALVQAAQPLARVVVGALGASLFLGGWQALPNGVAADALVRALEALVFVGKAWSCASLAELAVRAGPGRRGFAPLAFVAMGVIGGATLALPAARDLETRFGVVAFAATAIVLTIACAALARSGHPMGDPPSHPAPFA